MPEELIIPVRFDSKNAAADLRKVEQAGKAAGDETARGFDRASGSARGFGSELAAVMKAQIGLSAMRQTMDAVGDQLRQNAQYIAEQARQFQKLRAEMQQVAALTGQKNQTRFTLEQIGQAQAAGLKPEEWTRAQEEFQSRAGAYLEGDQARLTQQEGASYEQKLAAFARARGIPASEAMGLGGGLLQFSEGKQDVGGLMDRFGKVFKTLERAPTPVNQLLPQMSRVMAQGFSPEEASQALAIMSEAMPGEEETGVENALKAITNARLEGKGEELGLKEGMTPMQSLEAAAKTLRGRVAGGENVDELMKAYAPDLRERRGLLGFMNRGVGAGGFERVRGYAAETPADFTQTATEEYQTSDAGRQNAVDVALAAEQARMGARHEDVLRRRQIAEVELTRGGAFENPQLLDRAKALLPFSDDMREQQISRQAIYRLRSELGEQPTASDAALSANRGLADARLKELLERIESNTRPPQGQPAAAPALAAPPPAPAGRMGG